MYMTGYDDFMKKNGYNKPFPNFLYHYTNGEALINILENDEFWLTHVKFLNDRNEYYEGVDLILTILEQRSAELGDELYQSLKSVFTNDQWLDKPLNEAILSFSTHRDLLSQWRGYTKIGTSFCIGLDTKKLLSEDIRAHLRPCIYDKTEKEDIVNSIIKQILDKYLENGKKVRDANAEAFWLFQESAITFKSDAFKEENEWRLITFPFANNSPEWNFRTCTTTIVPFVKQKIDLKLCLHEIIIGPSENQKLSKDSLFFLMLKKDLWRNNVKLSNVPYRTI